MNSAVPRLAYLPGPSAHLQRVQDDLAAGRTCLWLLPDPVVECGDALVLMQALTTRLAMEHIQVLTVDPPDTSHGPVVRTTSVEQRVHASTTANLQNDPFSGRLRVPGFGRASPSLRRPAEPSVRPVDRLLDRLPAKGDDETILLALANANHVLAIRAWMEPVVAEVATVAHRLPSLARATGMAPADSGRLLVLARRQDVPLSLIDALHREPNAVVHWWWGAVSRADTLAIVWNSILTASIQRDHVLSALRAETIAEIAGPNLSLALDLTAEWTGDQSTLGPVVAQLFSAVASADPLPIDVHANRDRPPPRLTASWAAGQIDLWDDRLRAVWPRLTDADVRHAQWAAQLGVLLPAIELARQRLADELVAAGADRSLRDMEIGPMRRAALNHPVWQPTAGHRDRLNKLLSARNDLAHRLPLDDAHLKRLGWALRQ